MARRAARNVRSASFSASGPKSPENAATLDIQASPDAATFPVPTNSNDDGELVREHSDWAHDIEADIQRNLARLANLAVDDNQTNPSQSSEQHYQRRLKLLLNDKSLRFACGEIGVAPIPSTAEPGTPPPRHARLGSGHANYVAMNEFRECQKTVEALRQMTTQLMQMSVYSWYNDGIFHSLDFPHPPSVAERRLVGKAS